ncbi:hypothetical protein X279_07600 [Oenococcus oeni IOEB_0501]|nr:hypothetical protein X279_07600 [Oenococcus oeni IOEB_0501]
MFPETESAFPKAFKNNPDIKPNQRSIDVFLIYKASAEL